MKQIVLRFDEVADADLLAALERLPKGDRSSQIRAALHRVFVEAPDLAAAVNRLADALGRLPSTTSLSPEPPKPTSLTERMKDPAEKERIKAGLLGGFEK